MGTRGNRWAILVGLAASAAMRAQAGEEASLLLSGEKIRSTLASGERKTVSFAGVEGSSLSVSAKRVQGSRVVPTLTLLDPVGAAVPLGETNPKGGGAAQARKIRLDRTGVWRIGVATPAGAGGAFELSAAAKTPLSFSWKPALAAAAGTADLTFPAAPGGVATVKVTAKGRSAFDPHVEVFAPSGALAASAQAVKGRASLPLRLDELGGYVVRVSGGPGTAVCKVKVKPPKKRSVAYRDVEARPAIAGFTPASADNDTLVRFDLAGFGYSTAQTVTIVDGVASKATAPVKLVNASGAAAEIDLSGVAPGTYSVRVVTPEGNFATAAAPFVVRNRTPGFTSVTPAEFSNRTPVTIDIRGAGFDPASVVSMTRVADGLVVPLTVDTRDAHSRITATVRPPLWATGACTLEVRDPDGRKGATPVDLLGFRAAPSVVRQYGGPGAWTEFFPRDSAFDAENGRVLLAMQERDAVSLVLFDADDLDVVDTLVITAADLGASVRVVRPRVAWDGVTDTFAIGVIVGTGLYSAHLRVVSSADLQTTRLQQSLSPGAAFATECTPAANADGGGYLVVFDQATGSGSDIALRAQPIEADLVADPARQRTVDSHPLGYIWEPVVAYQGDGRFVVAWAGSANDDRDYAVHATVVDAAGEATGDGPYVTATSSNWYDLFQPEVTPNPSDGSVLLGFTYYDVDTYRPGVQRLAPVTAIPGPVSSLDSESQLPEGFIDSVRWSPERNEFVATMTNVLGRVAVRRVNPGGTLRAAGVLESYEGAWGILWSGPQPGQLGLARAFDGVADDDHSSSTLIMQALAGPLR